MSDDDDKTNEPATTMPSNWWSTPPSGWDEVSESTIAAWRPDPSARELDNAAAERAMVFGFGSRAAYGTQRAWEDVEGHLKADWRESGAESDVGWEDVADAAKAGWAAASPQVPGGRPDAPVLAPARFDTPAEPGEHQVPGGRPDRNS